MMNYIKERYAKLASKNKLAFTILEVVVAVGIVTVLSYITIVNTSGAKKNITADKQMVEVRDVFLATDNIIDDFWDINEARESLFPVGAPTNELIAELVEYTTVPSSKLRDYTFTIDTQNRLVVKYKEYMYNGADKYMPGAGDVVVNRPEKSDVVVTPEEESNFATTDSDWSGDRDGEFRYIGSSKTVMIPHEIKGVKVTSYKNMFEGTEVTKVISNNLDVTDMSYMFKDTKAATLDLGSLDTSGVKLMSYMFTDSTANNESKLTTLDLSGFNTSNVVDMEGMFYRSKITTLDVHKFDTSNVINMSYMFYRDSGFSQDIINHINLGSFDTSNVFNMRNMFTGANEVLGYAKTVEDAERLNTSHGKPSTLRFIVMAGSHEFKWIPNEDIGYTKQAETGKGFYRYIGAETEVAMPIEIKGEAVTSYAGMFSGTRVDKVVSTNANITDMSRMFAESKANRLFMNEINTENVTNMRGMFENAKATKVDFTNFNTRNVVDMSKMFKNTKIDPLDVRNVNTIMAVNLSEMFAGYQGEELKLSSFNTAAASDTTDMFKGATATRGYARSQVDANKLNASTNRPEHLYFVVLAADSDFDWVSDSENGYAMAGQQGLGYWKYNGRAIEIELPPLIYGVPVTNYTRMFSNSPVIQVDSPNPNITNMSGMFYNSVARKLDLRKINTSSLTNMRDMFNGAKALEYKFGLDTSRVTDMSGLFENTVVADLDISSINSSSVTNMSKMFKNANLKDIDVSTLDINKVTNMSEMFAGYPGDILKLSNFNMAKSPNVNNMFADSLATTGYARSQADANYLNASNNKPEDLTFVVMATDEDFSGYRNGEFKYIGDAVELEVPHIIKGVKVTSYKGMFEGTDVKMVQNTNENITDMSYMFAGSTSPDLNLLNLYTKSVVNMEGMFEGSQVKQLNFRRIDTSNVVNMSKMFKGAIIPKLDISNLNVGKVKDMSDMFAFSLITDLNINGLNTANVTTTAGMFESAILQNINLRGFDTSSLTNISRMFKNSKDKNLDVGGFNVAGVENMQETFEGAESNTINISSWQTGNVKSMSGMFKNTLGTITGLESLNTALLEDSSNMFYGNKTITRLDLRAWNTSKLQNASGMFEHAVNLVDLDTTEWNTSSLTNIGSMFSNTKITEFDLSAWDTSKVTALNNAFRNVPAVVGFSKTQQDADRLNTSLGKPKGLIFGVRSTVIFIDRDEKISEEIIATGNPILPIPEDPIRTGYTFQGWYSNKGATGGDKFTPGDLVTGTVTYYARWTINDYTVTFDSNEGIVATPPSITKNYMLEIGALPKTSREGYDFLGWFTQKSGGTRITPAEFIIKDVTYYAQWKIQTRTFTFDSTGGEEPSTKSITKDFNSLVGELPTAHRHGFLLNGWYTEKTGGTKLTPTEPMRYNKVYYAQWRVNNRTFTFDANGGTNLNPTTITKAYTDPVGELPTVSRVGHIFKGWYTEKENGVKLTKDTSMTTNSTYYARWEIIRNTLEIDPNGGIFQGKVTPTAITKDYGTDTFIGIPKRDGHTFTGWTKTGQGELLGYGKHTPERSNADVADYWANRMSVYNNRRNGTTVITPETAEGQNEFNPSWPNTFRRVTSTGTDQSPGRGGFVTSERSKPNTVYYSITVARVPEGVYLRHHNNAVGTGSKFTWLTDRNGTGEIETYIYKLETGAEGTFSTFGHIAAYGGDEVLEWDVYYTHIFDATGSNGSMANSEMFKFDNVGNSKLKANWSINSYEAKFNGNGGPDGSSRVIEYSSSLGPLPTVTRDGYTFVGWFTSPSGGHRIDENTRLYEDTTYYAQWQVQPRTFTFDSNGGTSPSQSTITRNYNTSVGTLPTTSREGYTFTGWYTSKTGGSKLEEGYKMTSNSTYYAQWSINQYTIKFNSNGGTAVSDITKDYNATITAPTPTRDGYLFTGWDITIPSRMPARNLIATATWRLNNLIESSWTGSSSSRTRTVWITLDREIESINSVSVNTGNVEVVSISGDRVQVRVSSGASTHSRSGGSPADSKYVSGQTSSSYNSGGYSGSLSSYVYDYDTNSRYFSNQTSSTVSGYSGTLSSYKVYTDHPAHTKTVSQGGGSYGMHYRMPKGYGWQHYKTDSYSRSRSYNSGGYSGTLSCSGGARFNTLYDESGTTKYKSDYYRVNCSGSVTKPAYQTSVTRYKGTLYYDTPIYRYRGTVYRPDTTWTTYYYDYNVTVDYRPKLN